MLSATSSWKLNCTKPRVTINPVSSLFPNMLSSNSALSNISSSSRPVSSVAQQADASGLSPTAGFLSELQQLQTQSPSQFQQLVAAISNNLTQAAQAAANGGNTTRASQLNTLATQFQNAAQGGSIPTAQDLQKAGLSGRHHHHGGHHGSGQPGATNPFQTQSSDASSQDPLSALLGTTSSTFAG